MNTDSCNLRRVPNPLPADHICEPGDFSWSAEREGGVRYLYLCLPGEQSMHAIRCRRGADRGVEREWSWDGNEDKPTVHPSIHAPDQWHGWLRAGRLESC